MFISFVWGFFVRGVFGKGGFCPGGFCPGVYVRGVFVLIPKNSMAFGRLHRHTCLQTLATKNTTRHAYVSVNFKCYHPSPRPTLGQFFSSNSRGLGFPGTLNFDKLYTTSPFSRPQSLIYLLNIYKFV